MDKKECISKGINYYNNPDGGKLNCCESTLLSLCNYMGIESNSIPAIATSFGGGIGGCGRTCGCVTGAAMAIGLKFGRKSAEDSKDPATDAVREFMDNFQEKYNTTDCIDLIGVKMRDVELSDEEKKKQHDDICNGIMENTISWAVDIIDK